MLAWGAPLAPCAPRLVPLILWAQRLSAALLPRGHVPRPPPSLASSPAALPAGPPTGPFLHVNLSFIVSISFLDVCEPVLHTLLLLATRIVFGCKYLKTATAAKRRTQSGNPEAFHCQGLMVLILPAFPRDWCGCSTSGHHICGPGREREVGRMVPSH